MVAGPSRRSTDAVAASPLGDLLLSPGRGPATSLTILKAALAATIAWALAAGISGNSSAVFAPILAMLTVQASLFGTVAQGVQTIVGNSIGVALASVLVDVGGRNLWVLFLGTLAALAVSARLPLAPAGRGQVAFSVLLVLLLGPTAHGYGLWRLLDCVIGGVVGIAVALLIPERAQVEPARTALREWTVAVRRALEQVADDLRGPGRVLAPEQRHPFVLEVGESLRAHGRTAAATLVAAEESVRFNPRARQDRKQVAGLDRELGWNRRVSLQARSISLAVDQLYDRPGWPPRLDRSVLAGLLQDLADLISRRLREVPLAPLSDRMRESLRAALDDLTAEQRPLLGVLDSVSLLGRVEQLRQTLTGEDPETDVAEGERPDEEVRLDR